MHSAAVDLVRSQIIKHNSHLAGMLFSLGLKYQRRHHARNIHFPRQLDLRRLQDPRRPRLDLRGEPNSKHCTNYTPLAEHMCPCVCECNCFISMHLCQSLVASSSYKSSILVIHAIESHLRSKGIICTRTSRVNVLATHHHALRFPKLFHPTLHSSSSLRSMQSPRTSPTSSHAKTIESNKEFSPLSTLGKSLQG